MDESVDRRFGEIERRLTQIEGALHLLPVGNAIAASVAPVIASSVAPRVQEQPPLASYAPAAALAEVPQISPNSTPLPNPAAAPASSAESVAANAASDRAEEYASNMRQMWDGPPPPPPHGSPADPPPLPVRPLNYGRQAAATAAPAHPTFEQTVGLKWAGWIGAVALVIGAALGFKYAYDQGWLSRLPPQAKIGLLAMVGLALIGVGELVYRRVNRMSAAGFFGAGTAVLFLASYAGYAWYGLYLDQTAVALMGASALTGILVAARADLVSVAVLAIVGGNIGPLLLGAKSPTITPFFTYLLLLQVMALGLCVWRAKPKWWPLRGLTLATTWFWMIALGLSQQAQMAGVGMAFGMVYALLFQIELCVSTLRQCQNDPASQPATAPRFRPGATPGLMFSLLVTAALTTWVLQLEHRSTPHQLGAMVLALAIAAAIAGFALHRFRSPALVGIALSGRIQSVLLLMLAAPVSLTGPSLLFGWMLLAVGLAIIAATTGRRLAMAGAMLTWLLAVLFAAGWSLADANAKNIWLSLFGELLQARLIVAACLAVSGHVLATAARRMSVRDLPGERARDDSPPVLVMLLDIAAITALSAGLVLFASPTFATTGGIAYAVILFAASFIAFWNDLAPVAIFLLSVVAIKWAVLDVLQPHFDGAATLPQRLLLNTQTAVGAVLTICFGTMGWLHARRPNGSASPDAAYRASASAALIFGVMTFIAGFTLTMEVQRYWLMTAHTGTYSAWPGTSARDLLWTILWSACVGTWLMVSRLVARDDEVRASVLRCTLILSLLLAAKFMLFDVLFAAFDHPQPAVAVGLNLQVLAGLTVVALVGSVIALARKTAVAGFADCCVLVVPLLLLVIGSAEIDRYAIQQTAGPTWIVRQVGWSIYWSALAVALLIVGFARHLKALRVAALLLLGITLAKVTVLDLSTAGSGWRILSFIALGLLLLATSVLYGKLSGRMTQ